MINYIHELQITLSKLDPSPLLDFVQACDGTLWLAGNGGSAATAQHWACDLSKAAARRAQALGSNGAVLTAWANDDGYDTALARELALLARPGDRLICLSCSGRSANIVTAIGAAHRLGIPRLLITGKRAPTSADVPAIVVPHTHYGILEDCFGAIGHMITEALCQGR